MDEAQVDSIIFKTIESKGTGYVCSVESNNLTVANKNIDFQRVVNGALVNICDGSNLAKVLGLIHRKPFKSYIGADLFIKYVKMNRFKQVFLGNTSEVLEGLKTNLTKIDPKIGSMVFQELPFRNVEDFDYKGIAEIVNRERPDVIWVSLGAPKQEYFMARLLPFLDQGVMFGFGAIFNFNANTGNVRRAPKLMLKLNMEWLFRAFEEPKKNIPRYWGFLRILPSLVYKETVKRKLS